jgi:hypothetical protein
MRVGIDRLVNTVPLYYKVERLTDLQRGRSAYLREGIGTNLSNRSGRLESAGSRFDSEAHVAREGRPPEVPKGVGGPSRSPDRLRLASVTTKG